MSRIELEGLDGTAVFPGARHKRRLLARYESVRVP